MSLLQSLANDQEVWLTLFKNSAARPLALRRRFSAIASRKKYDGSPPMPHRKSLGVLGLGDLQYWELPAEAITKPFMGSGGRLPGIAEKERIGLVVGSLAGLAARPKPYCLSGLTTGIPPVG